MAYLLIRRQGISSHLQTIWGARVFHPVASGQRTGSPSCVPPSPACIPEQRPIHTCGPSAPDTHPAAPISRSLAASPSWIHAPAVTGPRQRLQTQRPPPVVVGQPLREETREALGREGCKRTGRPPLHDRLGAPARCPHPAAGGRHPEAEDGARFALLWAGGVRGHWPLGRRGHVVRGWG